ncbi:MAG TPA: SURF1 family protein [Gemmatimonadales bacterium]|nr:SURF1 family protein [Gemmatimonadales bacterium]
MRLDRRDWAGLAFALAIAALCVRLGFWQLSRLRQRRERNAAVLAARARPPLEASRALTADAAQDRQLIARGSYDFAHEQFWHGRSYEGVPGVDLITPLRLSDGTAVLVDRGWVPSPDGYHVDARPYREAAEAALLGLGVRAPRAPGDVVPGRLRDSLPYPILPFIIQELPAAGPLGRPDVGLRRWPAPELNDGPHLSYAIQWFSFAAIIAVGSAALLRQRRVPGSRPQSLMHTDRPA